METNQAPNTNQDACDWSRILRWFRLCTVSFVGGEITFGDDTDHDDENDGGGGDGDGIVLIGTDVLVVVRRDRQYWIAMDALLEVCGTCQSTPNERETLTLRSVVEGWVDEQPLEESPGDSQILYWHSFILRTGREVVGVVSWVTDAGVYVRRPDREEMMIPWANISAAVELQE